MEKLKSLGFERKGPVVLAILDGLGIGKQDAHNAVHMAKTPFLDTVLGGHHYTQLKAHGSAVGMPSESDMGNSEVGHNVLGAGRALSQGAKLVQEAIESKRVFEEETWQKIVKQAEKGVFHCIGLLSDGNVHSHMRHWEAVVKSAAAAGIKTFRAHILCDGRDVAGRSALGYIQQLESYFEEINTDGSFDYAIASGGGRMLITMDRYGADWPMVERGWNTHVLAEGERFESAQAAVEAAYLDTNLNDQYIPPFVIDSKGIQDGDAVLMINFRGDRAMELCEAFEADTFEHFDRKRRPDVLFVGMMQYDAETQCPKNFLVSPPKVADPMAMYCAELGLKTLAISETQKYGHVTYFWNGNRSGYFDEALETFIEIPSDDLPFELQPAMKAHEITQKSIEMMQKENFDFVRINYPNGDMIGHTGHFDAVVKSIETVDTCLISLNEAVQKAEGTLVLVADHGNADEMYKILASGEKQAVTSHSLNPVPFKILDYSGLSSVEMQQIEGAGLANVTATLLNLLGYQAPDHFEESLIKVN